MDVPELYPEDLANLFLQGRNDPSKRPVLILGAGASIPSLPSAYNLKVQIGSNAVKQAFDSESLTEKQKQELAAALTTIEEMCAQEHITLEVLVSLITFRSDNTLDTDAMWDALCDDCAVNEFSHIIALLVKLGCVDRILTSNFDHVLEDACHDVGAEYEVVTNVQLEAHELNHYSNSSVTQISPFHGTTYKDDSDEYTGPFTATAAGLAKPFSKRMAEYVEDSLSENKDRPIIVFGYSGSDHFDLNPLLSSLHLEDEQARSNWYWCIHSGNANYCSQAVRNIFGASTPELLLSSNALYGADTLSVMKGAFDLVQVGITSPGSLPTYEYKQSASIYEDRLEKWFTENFTWSKEDANNMIQDLQSNLTAAWIVSEHYRLVQLGYDEEYCFRFAGIFDINTSSLNVGRYPHLAVTCTLVNGEKEQVEFGYILEAARIYRLEMNDKDQSFTVTSGAMNSFIDQALKCIDIAPRRGSDLAALYVGLAIAYDYLGLIGGRHVTKALKTMKKLKREMADPEMIAEQEDLLAAAREKASDGFGKCITYATKAKKIMSPSLGSLIPALTWIQVGLDNMGRFKVPGSDEAINWLTKAIKGRKEMIANDIQTSIDAGETDVATSKVVAVDMHYPPLWRRGGELVQQILETQGFNSAPNKVLSDLNDDRRNLAEFGFITSEDAYEKFRELNKAYNLNFPAIYDVRVLMALANRDTNTARNEVANCRAVLEDIPRQEFTESKIRSTITWINNIEARIDDFISQQKSIADVTVKDSSTMTHKEITLMLKEHLDSMGKNGLRGFHYMDQNGNNRVGVKEIAKELNGAGLDITTKQVRELIGSFVRPGGELDAFGYMRFIERAAQK